MLTLALVNYRAWILSPRRGGGAGLTVLMLSLCRLRLARYVLQIARVQADLLTELLAQRMDRRLIRLMASVLLWIARPKG